MKILCTSDIHLGRQPSLRSFPGQELSSRAAWDFVVASALHSKADLLILAGDIIERDNRYFEAWAPLKEGVLRLLKAGVTLVAVAGNHDAEVLPRLHAELALDPELQPAEVARFVLLGRGLDGSMGQWTQQVVTVAGDSLRLVGWSFPGPHHSANPLHGFPALAGDLPTLGVLHGDLDVPASPYAPFSSAALRATPVERWVLGHVHLPTASGPEPFYCGSPMPLRASETGAHGCWLLELRGRAWSAPVLVPSPVRIEALEVALTLADSSEAQVQAAIHQGMRDAIRRCRDTAPELKGVLFRIALSGETALPALVESSEFAFEQDGVQAAIHGAVENLTHPPLPLELWCQEKGAKGMLAGLIQELDRGADPAGPWAQVLDGLRALERESLSVGAFSSLEGRWTETASAASDWDRLFLRRACVRLLTALAKAEAAHV